MNLEQEIQNWRREMGAAGISSGEALDEFQSHLREEINRRIRAGSAPDAAFAAAVARLGQPTALKQEFERTVPPWDSMSAVRRPRNVALAAGGVLVAVSAVPCVMNTFPEAFAYAFSEHADAWHLKSYLIMGAVVAAWALALTRLGRALAQLNAAGRIRGIPSLAPEGSMNPKTRLIVRFEASSGKVVTLDSWDLVKAAFSPQFGFRRRVELARRRSEALLPALRFAATLAMFAISLLYLMSDPHDLLTWFKD